MLYSYLFAMYIARMSFSQDISSPCTCHRRWKQTLACVRFYLSFVLVFYSALKLAWYVANHSILCCMHWEQSEEVYLVVWTGSSYYTNSIGTEILCSAHNIIWFVSSFGILGGWLLGKLWVNNFGYSGSFWNWIRWKIRSTQIYFLNNRSM